jgi:hypothetical protein
MGLLPFFLGAGQVTAQLLPLFGEDVFKFCNFALVHAQSLKAENIQPECPGDFVLKYLKWDCLSITLFSLSFPLRTLKSRSVPKIWSLKSHAALSLRFLISSVFQRCFLLIYSGADFQFRRFLATGGRWQARGPQHARFSRVGVEARFWLAGVEFWQLWQSLGTQCVPVRL